MKLKIALSILLILPFLAFSSDKPLDTEYYYNLSALDYASHPRHLNMIKINNINHGIPIVQKGILFSYKSRHARKVFIAGNFSNWQKQPMDRNSHGVWYFFLGDHKIKGNINYKFSVDGVWTPDPNNTYREDDGSGSYISMVAPAFNNNIKHLSYRQIEEGTIEFRLYSPRARSISLVGDFNHWNPENDLMHKNDDGTWHLIKKIPPGSYRYKYIIDGKWTSDLYNRESASDNTGEVCSVLRVE